MPFNFEEYAIYIIIAGVLVFLLGYFTLIRRAFAVSRPLGLLSLLPPMPLLIAPLAGKTMRLPFLLALVGLVLALTPLAVNRLAGNFIDLGAWEKQVDGELHLTLTGWDRSDYAVLKQKQNAAVLQMANRDVTDATLDFVTPMSNLRELDLNDTQVTDAGLAKLKELKKLEGLRLRGTAITDAGLTELLAYLPELKQVDVRGTKISPTTISEWQKAKPGRRGMADRPPPTRPAASTPTSPTLPAPTTSKAA